MITSGRFLRPAVLIFFSLAALIHFYFNRTTLNPHYGKVFYRLGRECQDKCGLDEQLSYFQKAVLYDPNLNDAYYRMGIIYGKQGQMAKEFAAYQKTAALDHTNADAYFKAGRTYFKNGAWDYAVRYLLQSNRHKPGSQDTFNYLARSYEKRQMYKEAAHYYVSVVSGQTFLSAEACQGLWRISRVLGQREMVLDEVYKMHGNPLWEQVDRYLRKNQVPEFMRKPMETGTQHD